MLMNKVIKDIKVLNIDYYLTEKRALESGSDLSRIPELFQCYTTDSKFRQGSEILVSAQITC